MDKKNDISQLEAFGKTLFGQHFKIHLEDHETITKLLIYFLKNEQMAQQHNINLNKGILLTGPVGCGKTTLMKLLRAILPEEQRFGIKSCREITFDFITHGYEIIQRHSTNAYNHRNQPYKTCFDDLGAESALKYYGNECNVMGEILLSRYDHFISNYMLTHATTNLSASELESYYGNRVRSRMREMFNLIAFNTHSIDKRR